MLGLLSFLSACGTTYSPAQTVRLQPDVCVGADLASIQQAMAVWNSAGAHLVLSGPADAVLPMVCEPESQVSAAAGYQPPPGDTFYGDYDQKAAAIAVAASAWALPGNMHPVILAHEIGHAFGLVHEDDPDALMNPTPCYPVLNATDLAQLHALYPDVAP